MNASDPSVAVKYIQEHFDVAELIRGWTLELLYENYDASLESGNNWSIMDLIEGDGVKWTVCLFYKENYFLYLYIL
jgi:hypothetical protein